jgi:hypothetical protein
MKSIQFFSKSIIAAVVALSFPICASLAVGQETVDDSAGSSGGSAESSTASPSPPAQVDPDKPATAADIQTLTQSLKENLDVQRQEFAKISNVLMTHENYIMAHNDDIKTLQADIKTLTEQLTDLNARQQDILSNLAAGGEGELPRLSAMMDSNEKVREDWTEAVHKVMKSTGTVIIRNKTDFERSITVNGMELKVPAKKDKTITDVPVGTFITNLEGEGARTWSLAPPNYEQAIDIVPKQTTAARPIENTVTSTVLRAVEVPTTTTYYAPSTTTYYTPSTTSYYTPSTTTYYSPTTTSYYAPSSVAYSPISTTSYYAPSTTAYYALNTSYYSPTTAYYAPTTSYYPTTAAYYGSYYRRGLFGWGGLRGFARRNFVTALPY